MDTKITINIGGMSCAACSAAVERSIKRLEGVKEVTVNIATNNAVIVYDEEILKLSDIKSAIKKAGFKPLDSETDKNENIEPKNTMRSRLILAVVFGALLMYVSMGHMINLPLPEIINPEKNAFFFALTQLVLTIPILISGRDFFIKGAKSLFSGSPNMDTLVSMGSTCSFLYSVYTTVLIALGNHHLAHSLYFESAGLIITFILVGKTLENNSKIKTSQSIYTLMKKAPKTAIVIREGTETEIAVDD
ncbi:MAG: heavy metal translocating P-type ATPase, partial [Clostridia bacterium]|nr:heavy metal translocating P-type ATPase [Clostridia bacterium]